MLSGDNAARLFNPGPRTNCEPGAKGDVLGGEALCKGLSSTSPCLNCQRSDHETQNCPQPKTRRWNRRSSRTANQDVLGTEAKNGQAVSDIGRSQPMSMSSSEGVSGRIFWFLGRACVEMSVPTGGIRCFNLPIDVKAGSRAVGVGGCDAFFILDNGSSRLSQLWIGNVITVEDLTVGTETTRFRSSLGSRLLLVGSSSLLVTGTPSQGAHTPWLFDLHTRKWTRLPDAPHPILSSAVIATEDAITIVGGWSKQRSCHGHTQTLLLQQPLKWTASHVGFVPWRRPGAGCMMPGFGALVALGWMECHGAVGSWDFRLLPRNGSAQRARTSSSKLCRLDIVDCKIEEIVQMPLTDSFEHNGEIYQMGNCVVCIGRDHVQAFDVVSSSWQTWALPRQLCEDSSNSWVKHCGSWALAWLP